MDFYLELQLLPDPEFPSSLLMNALFAKLHRALVLHGQNDIGISFPDYEQRNLGQRIRLHGNLTSLTKLTGQPWLQGMRDHCASSGIQPVPANTQHCIVRRVQVKSSPERLRRRRIARGATPEQALHAIPDCAAERLRLPFITLNSQSSGQRFLLFIEQLKPQETLSTGSFNAYGLSSTATVPWF